MKRDVELALKRMGDVICRCDTLDAKLRIEKALHSIYRLAKEIEEEEQRIYPEACGAGPEAKAGGAP